MFFEVLQDAVIHHFRFVLRTDAREKLLLRLRDAQLIEGLLDRIRNIIPGLPFLLRRFDVVINVIQVKTADIAAPSWHRAFHEMLERLQTVLEHPLRFAFYCRYLLHNFSIQTFAGFKDRDIGIAKPILILVDILEILDIP